MCEYQRISRQSQSVEAMTRQRKKAVGADERSGVNNRSSAETSFPASRKKHVWEEDTSRLSPVQLRRKKRARQQDAQRNDPQEQEVRRHRPQQIEQPGNQGRVQKMIAGIYENTHAERSKAENTWVEDVEINGLCGGWAALHRLNPIKFKNIWTGLADWDEVSDITAHMNRYDEEPAMGWENYLISLANTAVGIMGVLEPGAGYQVLPDGGARELPDFDVDKLSKGPNKTEKVSVQASGAGAVVYNEIIKESKNKHRNPYIIHIETDHHHMSVRTRCLHGGVRIEEIVESEYAGVVVMPERREAESVLEHGIYLDGEKGSKPREQTVTLEFFCIV